MKASFLCISNQSWSSTLPVEHNLVQPLSTSSREVGQFAVRPGSNIAATSTSTKWAKSPAACGGELDLVDILSASALNFVYVLAIVEPEGVDTATLRAMPGTIDGAIAVEIKEVR